MKKLVLLIAVSILLLVGCSTDIKFEAVNSGFLELVDLKIKTAEEYMETIPVEQLKVYETWFSDVDNSSSDELHFLVERTPDELEIVTMHLPYNENGKAYKSELGYNYIEFKHVKERIEYTSKIHKDSKGNFVREWVGGGFHDIKYYVVEPGGESAVGD